MSRKEHPLAIRGRVEVHTPSAQKSNATITPEQRASLTAKNNMPDYLRENFLTRDHPSQMYWRELWEDGQLVGVVNTMLPSQGWGEGSIMVNAAPGELFSDHVAVDESGRFPVYSLYTDPPLLTEYSRQLLAGILIMEKDPLPSEPLPIGMPTIVAMENAMSIVSDEQRFASRSISLPHLQIVQSGLGITPDDGVNLGATLRYEQYLKTQVGNYDEVFEEIREKMGVELLERRLVHPIGYTIVTPITPEGDLSESARMLAALMTKNYHINSEIIGREIEKASIENPSFGTLFRKKGIPPYSNRHSYYFMPDDQGARRLHITVSPVLFGGGAREDNGNMMDRGPQFPRLFSATLLDDYYKKMRNKLHEHLD